MTEALKTTIEQLNKREVLRTIINALTQFESMEENPTSSDVVEMARSDLIEHFGDDVVSLCTDCEIAIMVGDKGFQYEDGDSLCLEHAPTWDDCLKHHQPSEADDEGVTLQEYYNKHIADGGKGSDKYVWAL